MKIFKLLATVAILALWAFPALADIQYGGRWDVIQNNGFATSFQITQTGLTLNVVSASYGTVRGTGTGWVRLAGTDLNRPEAGISFRINWDNGAVGDYTGSLHGDGYLRGTTRDINTDNGSVGWISSRTFNSMYEAYFAPGDCDFRQVTAKLEIGGIVRYDVIGTCLNQPMTGKMLYSDRSKTTYGLMDEKFYYNGIQLNVTARCPTDPWVSGAPCSVNNFRATGGNGLPLDNYQVDFQRYPAPLSLRVINDPTIFQTALAKAPHPSPPARPVNTKVRLDLKNRAVVYWLAPDENPPNGPYETFSVEGQQYQGGNAGAWVSLGTAKRRLTWLVGYPMPAPLPAGGDYRLSVQIPTSRTGIVEGWKFRACTVTRFTKTCSDPMTPAPLGTKESAQMNDKRTAAPLGGSDTLNTQKVLPTLQQPSAIPQSSPPKVLPGLSPSTSTTLNGRIFLRGVPQEGSPPAGTPPVEPKPAP